jgi:ketosteroid isomerase-like protein
MYSWLVGRIVRRSFAQFNEGNIDAILASFGEGARFVFPGDHSFAADTGDPDAISAWFTRFVALGPHFAIEDVLACGPPWNMRVAVRFDDRVGLASGRTYQNQGMQYLRMRWGKVQLDRIFLDTQALAAVDSELTGE